MAATDRDFNLSRRNIHILSDFDGNFIIVYGSISAMILKKERSGGKNGKSFRYNANIFDNSAG